MGNERSLGSRHASQRRHAAVVVVVAIGINAVILVVVVHTRQVRGAEVETVYIDVVGCLDQAADHASAWRARQTEDPARTGTAQRRER